MFDDGIAAVVVAVVVVDADAEDVGAPGADDSLGRLRVLPKLALRLAVLSQELERQL